jgi:hypothetical protein
MSGELNSRSFFEHMTVEIEVDEKIWAETERLAKDLNVDQNELFLNTLRANLYSLKREREKSLEVAEKERKHRESYEKYPVEDGEFDIDEDQINEVWKDL